MIAVIGPDALTQAASLHKTAHMTTGLKGLQMLVDKAAAAIRALPLFAAVAIGGWVSMPSSALADFRVCNATQSLVGVSIGYRAAAGWVTEGWWHVDASTCKTLIEGPLASRYYYLYAEDAERGGRWDGPINMCVAEKEFKVSGVSDCLRRGFQRAGFQEYDTGEQSSWMVELTDGAPAAPEGGVTPPVPPVPPTSQGTQ